MAEKLLIRLGSQASDPVHWLVWSSTEQNIIASGELASADQLEQLEDKAISRAVIALVSGADIALKSLHVPAKSRKAMQQAAPYMLEDDLAQDVEQLFFAYSDIKAPSSPANCHLAIVERQQMLTWQSWLSNAGIVAQQMIPDVLVLPSADTHWHAIQLDKQIIVRQGAWQGVVVDETLWPSVSQTWQLLDEVVIKSFSQLPNVTEPITVEQQPEELPLAIFAQQVHQQKFNLLQGEFQVKTERSPVLKTWVWAAGFVLVALLLNVMVKAINLMQINEEQAAIEQKIVAVYKATFPQTKRVRVSTIRSQLKRKLAEVGANSNDASFLALLNQIQPAFAQVTALKPETIKYDGKRNEIRLQASANGYQQFEQFKNLLEAKQLNVSQGSQSSRDGKVTGSFSISQATGGSK